MVTFCASAFARTQAIASCTGVTRFSFAIRANASTSDRFFSTFPASNRGKCARVSPGPFGVAPASSPRDSTPYAVIAMPNSRKVGMIFSTLRLTRPYSSCTSQMGCTPAARRTLSADSSESPM